MFEEGSFSWRKAGDGRRRLLETKGGIRLFKVGFPSVYWFEQSKVPKPGLSPKLALPFSICFMLVLVGYLHHMTSLLSGRNIYEGNWFVYWRDP